jgi:RNA polymerase sigma factor (sigma-70 family)
MVDDQALRITVGLGSASCHQRQPRREEAVPIDDETSTIDRYAADTVATDLLRDLPTRQREVATLFYVDDRTVAEIAMILRVNEGTVKYHLSHARDGLRKLLDEGRCES